MIYEELVKLNEKNKKKTKEYISGLSKDRQSFERKTHIYKLEYDNAKDIVLHNDKDLNFTHKVHIKINTISDIVIFLKNELNYISNISFLKNIVNQLNYYVIGEITANKIQDILFANRDLDYFKITRVDNLKKELSKVALIGGLILYNQYNCFAIVKKKNELDIISDGNIVLPEDIRINFRVFSKNIYIDNLDISRKEDLSYFFSKSAAENIILKNFDTSNCKIFSGMFEGCLMLKNVNVESIDTSNGFVFSFMFQNCRCLEKLDLNSWNMNKAAYINEMFENCANLKELKIDTWTTYNVKNNKDFLKNCDRLRGHVALPIF